MAQHSAEQSDSAAHNTHTRGTDSQASALHTEHAAHTAAGTTGGNNTGTADNATDHHLPWKRKVYRDAHGRGMRQPLFGARIPRYRTKAGRFDGAVVAQLKRLHGAWPELIEPVQCAVEDVPPSDPLPWEDTMVMRSRSFPAEHGQPARIVVYRRPLESIARDDLDLQLLIRDEIVARLAELTGKHPEDIDPDWAR